MLQIIRNNWDYFLLVRVEQGKSNVIEAIIQFTRNHFGITDGFYGPLIVTAPTGTSSNNINGFTNHSVCYFSRTKHNQSDQSSQKWEKE